MNYDERQHTVYGRARALPPETIAQLVAALAEQVPARRPLAVLDLGSGTGRFTPALAGEFGGPVHGVEPSESMRAQAPPHPGVTYLAGSAERIPLASGSCDLALLYLVLHHVADRPAAAREIARVLRPGGKLFVRGLAVAGLPEPAWYRYFPRARELDAATSPPLAETIEIFAAAGLHAEPTTQLRQLIAPSLAAYADRLRLRGISTFERLTPEETAAGFAALDQADDEGPVHEYADLTVFTSR